MAKILKPIGVAVVVIAVLLACLAVSSRVLAPKDNSYEAGMIEAEAHGVMAEPDDTIDVIILGDSEAYAAFSPLQMFQEQGFAAYTCSSSGQRITYANTILNRAMTNQSPTLVVFETNELYAPFSFNDIFMREFQDIFPVLEYHDRWKSLSAGDFYQEFDATWTDSLKGFKYLTDSFPADSTGYMIPSDEFESIPYLNQVYMHRMIAEIRAMGAEPVFISTPSTVNWTTARHNGMTAWAASEGVAYYDFNAEPYDIHIDWQTETLDGGDHLNYAGATRFTQAVGELLASEYNLPDHRGDPVYNEWNVCWECFQAQIMADAEQTDSQSASQSEADCSESQ